MRTAGAAEGQREGWGWGKRKLSIWAASFPQCKPFSNKTSDIPAT